VVPQAKCSRHQRCLGVVAPQPQHFHQLLICFDAVDETMLDVDSAGIGPSQVTHQRFEGGWAAPWVFNQQVDQLLGPLFQGR